MTTGCYETSFLLFATYHATNARGLPGGGVFAAVIDSHISTVKESKFEIDELMQSNKIEINSVGNFKEG